jgi:hypothetical protein
VAIVGAGYAGLSASLVLALGQIGRGFRCDETGRGRFLAERRDHQRVYRPDYAMIARRFGEGKSKAIEVEGKLAREFLYDSIEPGEPSLRLRNGPELKKVRLSHSWFGNVAMNRDMLPRIFENSGVVYASGFCGSGVVWAPWIGTRAAHRLMGRVKEALTASTSGRQPPFRSIEPIPGSCRPSSRTIGCRT